jgi:hypothetical protein
MNRYIPEQYEIVFEKYQRNFLAYSKWPWEAIPKCQQEYDRWARYNDCYHIGFKGFGQNITTDDFEKMHLPYSSIFFQFGHLGINDIMIVYPKVLWSLHDRHWDGRKRQRTYHIEEKILKRLYEMGVFAKLNPIDFKVSDTRYVLTDKEVDKAIDQMYCDVEIYNLDGYRYFYLTLPLESIIDMPTKHFNDDGKSKFDRSHFLRKLQMNTRKESTDKQKADVMIRLLKNAK